MCLELCYYRLMEKIGGQYYNNRAELSVVNQLLLRKNRIVIPYLVPLGRHDTVRFEDSNNLNKKSTDLGKTDNGQILRRNQRSLLKTCETLQEQTNEDPACTTSAEPPAEPTQSSPVLKRSTHKIKAPDRLNH
ncbi:hypothetical protein N1851_024933 [Merluccius polli]|uniref:Uncharacterized protein n=1 Tax=Merluccius polli TaxID=89951 RepID=A0AA47MDZ0_MERPO|nr:hypothetical protein N1851_024933 [Merluccius polli]